MLKVTPVRAFSDNYIWLIHGLADPRSVAIIDPGDPRPVLKRLDDDGLDAVEPGGGTMDLTDEAPGPAPDHGEPQPAAQH